MSFMPAVYDKILSCFALGLGHPEDYFREVRARCPLPLPSVHCPCQSPIQGGA